MRSCSRDHLSNFKYQSVDLQVLDRPFENENFSHLESNIFSLFSSSYNTSTQFLLNNVSLRLTKKYLFEMFLKKDYDPCTSLP